MQKQQLDATGRVMRTGVEPAARGKPTPVQDPNSKPRTKSRLRTRLTLRAGQDGTKRLVRKYGARLLAVRYRYDLVRGLRLKTVELIEESLPWAQRSPGDPEALVLVSVGSQEGRIVDKIRAAGGRWEPKWLMWRLPRREAWRLKLDDRIYE